MTHPLVSTVVALLNRVLSRSSMLCGAATAFAALGIFVACATVGNRVWAADDSPGPTPVGRAPAPDVLPPNRSSEIATPADGKNFPHQGYLVNVPLPIDSDQAQKTIRIIQALAAENVDAEQRTATIVLRFGNDMNTDETEATAGDTSGFDQSTPSNVAHSTQFEVALMLARFLTSSEMRRIKTVAWLVGPVDGHAMLPVLACDQIITRPSARLGKSIASDEALDPVVRVAYETIAARRLTIPMGVVAAMIDPQLELVRVRSTDGRQQFLSGDELQKLRTDGEVWDEVQLSPVGTCASFTGTQLREFRWATHQVSSIDQAISELGLQSLQKTDLQHSGPAQAVLAEVIGPIHQRRMRRVMGNILDAKRNDNLNHLVLHVDSAGGDYEQSANLALSISQMSLSQVRTSAFVSHQALGDAAIVALGARHVYMTPDARLGGPGAASLSAHSRTQIAPLVAELARTSRRNESLLLGLIDPEVDVYKYEDSRTGRTEYFTPNHVAQMKDPRRWVQQQQIDLAQGIDSQLALELGLIEAIAPNLQAACELESLPSVPPRINDRAAVRFVEGLGRQVWLPRVLLFIGFTMFAIEMGAPGFGVSGFISLCCILLFFWIRLAGGTAEWLEILLFTGGVLCILCEVFLIPGFGIFGIGGFVMIVSSLILASQTFVLPNNPYQYQQMSQSLAGVLVAVGGVIFGALVFRTLFPQLPFFRHLIMTEDPEQQTQRSLREELVHWDHLVGQQGQTTTPLIPAGKARFGDEVVAVISQGKMIEPGKKVLVKSVQGNRVLVSEV